MSAPASGGALVTGAGRGLGLEIARRLAARGYTVHVTDVDAAAAERGAAELGAPAFASGLDVADAAACVAAAQATQERSGSLAVWVNNAGVLRTGHSWEHDEAERRLMFEANTFGTINGTLAALDLMRPAGAGHVINIVSLAGLVAAPGETVYSASKHAALAFSFGTRFDLRRAGERGVEISCVCPDGIWTPMLQEKVNDPEAAMSWSGVMLPVERVADRAVAMLDRPRPVVSIPRWRGLVARVFHNTPGLAARAIPMMMRDARRRQRSFARKVERGEKVP